MLTKRITSFICLIVLAIPGYLHAQYNSNQNKVWIFGRNAGVNFNTGSPVVISSKVFTDEGSASLSDASGNLLFYSQGDSVWNRHDTVMPNGRNLAPFSCNSTTQAAVIAPVIGTPNQYYLFSLEHILASGRLAYSIVDMSLNGGLGDVPSGSKGIMIDSGFAEKMVTVKGGCGLWLIVHKVDSPKFYAYQITSAGINPVPVVSRVGTYDDYEGYGVIKVSPDRSKLALTHFELSTGVSRLELFDFNAVTGVVSHCRILNTYSTPYGAEFSADNSKLYVHHWTYGKILQYDVSLATDPAIIASEYVVAGSLTVGSDMKLGPDGKIYFSSWGNYLDQINAPNLAGSACNYAQYAISMAPNMCVLGLPAVYWTDTTCPTTGIQPLAEEKPAISVYPNPAKDRLTIVLPGTSMRDIQVIDILGRTRVSATGLNGNQIDLDIADLPDGNYFVRVNCDGSTYRSAFTVAGKVK